MSEKNNYIQGETGPWEVVIGLEVHAQVTSKAKLFSGASTAFGGDPNTQVSFIDAGFPGMLPVINDFCIEQAIKTGFGLNAQINKTSIFDRKNYFYADLPQGYQISQHLYPIVGRGYLEIELEDGTVKRINITRLHLEQDAGKSIHDQHPSKTYIDLNRSGIALMEIVSEPDIRSVEEAQAYIKKLRGLLRYLGTCDGNMEQGSLRADVNVSLRRPGEDYGTRAEIKNVNSVRFMGQAITYEIQRQMEILENGGQVDQETRLFDASKGITRSMRNKEDAHDYRYFPDPDLPPLVLSDEEIERIRAMLPELPDAKKARFIRDYQLSAYDAGVLSSELETVSYFETALTYLKEANEKSIKQLANWIIGELFAALNRDSLLIEASKVSPQSLAELINFIYEGTISGRLAKDIFAEMWETGEYPDKIINTKGLIQVSDEGTIATVIEKILSENQDKVTEYQSGKDKLFGFFVGQVMKMMQGKGNPAIINKILLEKLKP
ncbi:glutamyl-tRNA amidotransferase [Candidatus Paracaedimonas acanthamoebae]|nr:glutamyl-tRNA amidotransferase [Candidatus Paracaedimonas acanthamoebae]